MWQCFPATMLASCVPPLRSDFVQWCFLMTVENRPAACRQSFPAKAPRKLRRRELPMYIDIQKKSVTSVYPELRAAGDPSTLHVTFLCPRLDLDPWTRLHRSA
ncbi:hypothetical protein AcW2_004815 [Taiwanofungus camphoratus]|nr:hypothetical protein AcW2_004815 [Antrodia cinnamomea]